MSLISIGYLYRDTETNKVHIVEGFCTVATDGDEWVLYRRVNIATAKLLVRPMRDFLNGHFERVTGFRTPPGMISSNDGGRSK